MTHYSTPEEALENILTNGPMTRLEMRVEFAHHFPLDRFDTAFHSLVKDSILTPDSIEPGVPSEKWRLA